MIARILALLTYSCGILLLLAFGLRLGGPQFVLELSHDSLGHLRGYSYAYVIPKPWGWPVLRTTGDEVDGYYSRLVLSENGVPLKYPHANAPTIDTVGEGRYAHMRTNELYFSTSDNSDPRSNGRTYEISVPLTPAPSLTKALLMATLLLLGAWALARSGGRWRWHGRTKFALTGFAVYALIWQVLIWDGRPHIINSGDGGVVAGIAAANLWPDRLASDIVYSNIANFSFYKTLTIPLTIALTRLTDDVGTSYALLSAPLLLIQMFGFYLLGRRLCPGYGWPTILAFLSVAPVYVINGELWGSLSEPLTRYAFNAFFPFVLLTALPPIAPWKPFTAMVMCAIGIYLHPVSAPSVALALWTAFALQRPPQWRWSYHLLVMIAAGSVFLIAAIPFALSFVVNFPTQSNAESAHLAGEILRDSVGSDYVSLPAALISFLHYTVATQQQGFGWLWLVIITAALMLWKVSPRMPRLFANRFRFVGLVGVGFILSSVGLTALDQTLAILRNGYPAQMDLIRNIRFLVPIALILTTSGVAWLAADITLRPLARSIALACGGAIAVLWMQSYPTVPLQELFSRLDGRINLQPDGSAQRALALLARAPSGGSVLTLPATISTPESEFVGLAVRYAGRQPTIFLQKDINLLAYSSSSSIQDWDTRQKLLKQLEMETDPARVDSLLNQMTARYGITYVLMNKDVSGALRTAIIHRGNQLGPEGDWVLQQIRQH